VRGFVGDTISIMIQFFVLAIFFVAIAYTGLQLTTTPNATINAAASNSYSGLLQFDWIAPLMVLALGIALIGSALFIRTSPIFFLGFFIVNACFAYASMFISNAWQGMFVGSALATTANNFSAWTLVMQYFPFIALALGILFGIAIFAKGGE
jgi:hypothetical protein